MSPSATFVFRQENGQGHADIRDDHQELIAYIWLAIEQATPADIPDGYSKESLQAHFASELGINIGRAHNWDKTRKKGVNNEAYDDGEGDKPTCHMGVTRRLAQFLLTLLKPTKPEERALDVEILKARLRDEFIASNSSETGYIDVIKKLEYSDLKRLQSALAKLGVEFTGDFEL